MDDCLLFRDHIDHKLHLDKLGGSSATVHTFTEPGDPDEAYHSETLRAPSHSGLLRGEL